MDGIVRNHIELLMRRPHEVSGIVINDLNPRVLQYVVILLAEICSNRLWDQRLDFAYDDTLNAWIQREYSCGHAGAEANNENRARCRIIECGQMTQHALHLHVAKIR